jgi:hypothetical protein
LIVKEKGRCDSPLVFLLQRYLVCDIVSFLFCGALRRDAGGAVVSYGVGGVGGSG